jgi:hypothetical protein
MRCPLTGEYNVGNNWKETHWLMRN